MPSYGGIPATQGAGGSRPADLAALLDEIAAD
ncbi:hypothetical protein ABH926_006184 [Catenulispora sp. GP43]